MRKSLIETLLFSLGLIGVVQAAPAIEFRGVVPASMPADGVVMAVPLSVEQAGTTHWKGRLQVGEAPPADVVVQTEPADARTGSSARAWVVCELDGNLAGKSAVLQLEPVERALAADAYRIREADPLVEVTSPDGKLVLAYRHGKPDPMAKYPMTSYIHPLMGLDGEVLTDCLTKDHPHHRGLFWAWVRVERDGEVIGDWWIPQNIALRPGALHTAAGPLFVQFVADHDWMYAPGATTSRPEGDRPGEPLINEHVVCRVFETTAAGRAIDVDVTLTALQDGLKIGGQTQLNKGYGGLTLRFGADPTHAGRPRTPRVVADGKFIATDLNHVVARWVDWTAVFEDADGKLLPHRSGGAVFVHPSHPPLPVSPPEWITRNYGPINVAYPGLEMLSMPRGKPLTLRYRVWLHRNDAEPADVGGQYAAYAADWKWENITRR